MSVTFTFHTVAERKPAHGQGIIWLRKTSSFGHEGFDPRQIEVEYVWDDGEGCSCGYDGEEEELDGFSLRIMFDGEYVDEEELWIPLEEYWAAFDKAGL